MGDNLLYFLLGEVCEHILHVLRITFMYLVTTCFIERRQETVREGDTCKTPLAMKCGLVAHEYHQEAMVRANVSLRVTGGFTKPLLCGVKRRYQGNIGVRMPSDTTAMSETITKAGFNCNCFTSSLLCSTT